MGSGLKFEAKSGDITQISTDAILVGLFEDWQNNKDSAFEAIDKATNNALSAELSAGKYFKSAVGETLAFNTCGKLPARFIIVTGLGKQAELDIAKLRRASAAAIRACQKLKLETMTSGLLASSNFSALEASKTIAEGARLGQYQFKLRKSKKDDAEKESKLETLTIIESDAKKLADIEKGLKLGKIIGKHVNLVRDWVNDSANYVTPTFLKNEAEDIKGIECNVLDFKDIQKQKMGLFELVAKGSDEPSYIIHMSYKPKSPKKKITLVGKGLTFDSGGLSLKPAKSMETMKMDMAGAAVVLSVMRAISKLHHEGYALDVQVDGYIGTCENMPSGRSSKPGDIAVSLNGKTVEVNNTDAEGRLVLADVLTYAQRTTDPDVIIDLATLTGACVVALGTVACGIMGTDDALIQDIIKAGKPAGEKIWQLPLYDEYKKSLESEFADLINANSQGEAGSQNGGIFLKEFIDENRAWAHMDIAGAAWGSRDYPETPKAATGFAVRTLLNYLYNDFSDLK